MVKKLVSFYYPSKNIGGAQLLFSRIAEALYNRGFEIKIYLQGESYISSYLTAKSVKYISSSSNETNIFEVEEGEILILSMSYLTLIESRFRFKSNTKLIFWDLHSDCLIEQLVFSGVYKKISKIEYRKFLIRMLDSVNRKKIRNFIASAAPKNGAFFLSKYNENINRFLFDLSNPVCLLPIPIPNQPINNLAPSYFSALRIGWLSRLERDKNLILTLLIEDIIVAKELGMDIKLIIIGDGNDQDFIKNYAKKSGLNDYLFIGKVETEKLGDYIIQNVDVGFAMGTSSLEFANFGIPSVLVPPTTEYRCFKNNINRYKWLHNAKGFDINTYEADINNNLEFQKILSNYLSEKVNFKVKTLEYVKKNHSLDFVVSKLIASINNCTFTYEDLCQTDWFKKSIFQSLLYKLKRAYKAVKY